MVSELFRRHYLEVSARKQSWHQNRSHATSTYLRQYKPTLPLAHLHYLKTEMFYNKTKYHLLTTVNLSLA